MAIKYPPDKLSRSQLIVNNLPVDKNYVINGGPGTGKTLLALQRADRIRSIFKKEHGRDPQLLFIVYNRPLQNYLKSIMSLVGLTEDEATTYHSWVWRVNREHLDRSPDELAAFRFDWAKVKEHFRKLRDDGVLKLDHVILDEAQDLPQDLVSILHEVSDNITVFMDDHQMIDEQDHDHDVREIKLTRNRALQIVADGDPYRSYALQENHRNSQAIVELAMLFLPDDAIAQDALNKGGRKPEVLVCDDLGPFAEEVASYAENNPDQNIAVFLPSNEEKSSFAELLREYRTVENGVREYKDGKQTPNFDPEERHSVKIFTYRTFKGLEFDAVFMPEIDNAYFSHETQARLNQSMVGITRAKERVFLGCKSLQKNNSFFLRRLLANQDLVETRVLSTDDTDDDDDDILF